MRAQKPRGWEALLKRINWMKLHFRFLRIEKCASEQSIWQLGTIAWHVRWTNAAIYFAAQGNHMTRDNNNFKLILHSRLELIIKMNVTAWKLIVARVEWTEWGDYVGFTGNFFATVDNEIACTVAIEQKTKCTAYSFQMASIGRSLEINRRNVRHGTKELTSYSKQIGFYLFLFSIDTLNHSTPNRNFTRNTHGASTSGF